jgi:malonyl-CoA decarboxylase
MNAANWLAKHWPGLRGGRNAQAAPETAEAANAAVLRTEPLVQAFKQRRSIDERLKSRKRQDGEALSQAQLQNLTEQLRAVNDRRISEVEAGRRAQAVAHWYASATEAARMDLWYLLSEKFGTDMDTVRTAREQWEIAPDAAAAARAEMRMRKALESPRARLLQRFAVFDGGVRFLVDLRAELLAHTREHPALQLLDAELEAMFSTWFDVAFLELRRLSWDSPASLIEKLIKYEAVHDIRSWADLKNRLDSDRRCYGFFHPRLKDEPLIFVEVAFTSEVAASITPLLDESAAATDLKKSNTAIFYSISNTQKGLRGVSFGDSLIKRVVETLRGEFPKVKTFATLSPIPGYRKWLQSHLPFLVKDLPESTRKKVQSQLAVEPQSDAAMSTPAWMGWLDAHAQDAEDGLAGELLLHWAAVYLGRSLSEGLPTDPVARFHLGNGARVERLNPAADPSAKGKNQAFGLMVNYLYDLKRIDDNRAQLGQGKIAISSTIAQLIKSVQT